MPRKTAQQRLIERLLQKQTAAIRKAFMEAMDKGRLNIDQAALIRFLEQGDIERAAQLFRLDRGVLFPLENAIREAVIAGGLSAVTEAPKGLSAVFGFNGSHPRAVALAERQAGALITNITDEAIGNARRLIVAALEENRSLNALARDLVGRTVGNRRVGGVIGLTKPQIDDMMSIRQILRDPNQIRKFFIRDQVTGRWKPRYKLSDRRFDSSIRTAIKEGRALTSAQVDAAIEAYKVKAAGYRGRTVARNEAFTAQAAGRDEGYRQVKESGKVESVTCRWQHNLSQQPREDHVAMDGTVIEVGEDFVFPDGTRMSHPHDPRGGAKHSIGCRCIGVYRIKLPKG